MERFFSNLRAANLARQEEWPGNERCDVLFRAIEVGGEIGELLMVIHGFESREGLADEFGDVIISLDLLKSEIGAGPIEPIFCDLEDAGFEERGFMLLEAVKKFYRAQENVAGGHSEDPGELVLQRIGHIAHLCVRLAGSFGLNIEEAVASKFNKTSVKHGFKTFLSA